MLRGALLILISLVPASAAAPHYFLTTLAGNNPSISAPVALDQPPVVAVVGYNPKGVLYYAGAHNIWRLNPDGSDTLVAGSYSTSATFREGEPAVEAPLNLILDFKFDSLGNLYIADAIAAKVYKVTPGGAISTFAGSGSPLLPATLPSFGPGISATSVAISPENIAIDSNDNVYVQIETDLRVLPYCSAFVSFPPDGSSSALVAIGLPCRVTSALGPAFDPPASALSISGSEMFVTMAKGDPNTLVTYEMSIAGPSNQALTPIPVSLGIAFAPGPNGLTYFFSNPGFAEVDPSKNFAVDPLPNTSSIAAEVDSISVNPITGDVAYTLGVGSVGVYSALSASAKAVACAFPFFAGDGGPASLAVLNAPRGLAADAAGNLYVDDTLNSRIRKITPSAVISTIAGTGASGSTGDGSSALAAEIDPIEMAVDGAGNLYFINGAIGTSSGSVRKIDTHGNISTIAGGGAGKLVEGAQATSIALFAGHLAVDSAGDVYFSAGSQVWLLNASGTVSLFAGTGAFTAVAQGSAAVSAGLGAVSSLAIGNSGDVYIGDQGHTSIWQVDSQGNLNLIAGKNTIGGSSVVVLAGGPATAAEIGAPTSISVDGQGNVWFLTGLGGAQIGFVDLSGNLTVIGGSSASALSGTAVSSGDGADAALGSFASALGMTMDGAGNLYVSDGNLIREMSPFDPSSPPPFVSKGGVVGAGGSLPAVAAISPGGEVSVFGANFVSAANAHTVTGADLVNGKVPTSLAGVCASFGGSSAAMLGVYPGQLNVQVGTLSPGAVNVQVTTNCGTPQAVTSNYSGVIVQAASPEFYSFKPDPVGGVNPIAAVNAVTGAFIGPPNLLPGATFVAAKAGDIVQAYATGFGATTPAYGLGVIPGAAGILNNPYSLTLGGIPIAQAAISYAGISPCCAGFYQLDFTVPQGTPSGAQPLVITIAGSSSPPLAYIEIQ